MARQQGRQRQAGDGSCSDETESGEDSEAADILQSEGKNVTLSVCPVTFYQSPIILGQAALTSVEYEDHIRNEAEIKQKVGRLEKDLKVN